METKLKKILILEDDVTLQKLYSILLSDYELTFSSISTFMSDLDMKFNLIILDRILPNSELITGTDILEYISISPNKTTKILIISGVAKQYRADFISSFNIVQYLTKPVSNEEIVNAVATNIE